MFRPGAAYAGKYVRMGEWEGIPARKDDVGAETLWNRSRSE